LNREHGLGDCEEHDDVKEAMGDLIGPIGDCGDFAGNSKEWACGIDVGV
jgi:hypothetical protein